MGEGKMNGEGEELEWERGRRMEKGEELEWERGEG